MRAIVILGLNPKNVPVLPPSREVWTLGDWYRPFPWLRPARVYQIHSNFNGMPGNPERYLNWREEYAKSGAEIIVTTPLGFERERVFDAEKALAVFGEAMFGCTVGYMAADAVFEGVERIEFVGFGLSLGSEFAWQAPLMLCAIDYCRQAGIEVIAKDEAKWREAHPAFVDWSQIKAPCVIGDTRAHPGLISTLKVLEAQNG